MARRYARDNRGRFAPKGTGATARGGRLKTAGGSKRQTQTMQASAAPRAGAIRGKVKRDPTAASRVGQSAAAKPAAAKPRAKTNAAGLTRAEFEAAAQKAWGAAPKKATKRQSQSADQQLDRLVERSGNLARSRTGLTKSEAMKASDLGKATGRNVQVSQNERGGYTIKVAAAAAAAKPRARKVDLSQGAFESRASATEKRARAAERAVQGLDRSNPQNRRAFNRADALRSAADSYSSLARRGRTGDLPASALFQGRFRGSTAPKLTRSQKAAATRQANKDRKLAEQIKAMERARRR